MSDRQPVVGIDLGTTYSEIAAHTSDRVRVLGPADRRMLPSCVGISPSGELLVGAAARNQHLLYPDRTVRSIKRKMGLDVRIDLGDRRLTPPEISALILRALVELAQDELGGPVHQAVITVPAYFSDAQRQATREAGALADLEVVRILNEPTAASLAYGYGDAEPHTLLVYDLGGGTFDVSIVRIEGEVTEVLASHGNNHLGGDDFDKLLVDLLADEVLRKHGVDVRKDHPAAHARLASAAEKAKRLLSSEPYATVREEALIALDGRPVNLEREISREEYESLIGSLVRSTLDSVSKAMEDARMRPQDLDAVLLAGGSTRTPLVSRSLAERTGLTPREEVHPDLCVALGAGVLAARLAGEQVQRVLVDVSPYSFGPSYLGERGGHPYPHCYQPLIHRNTPLPATRTESYATAHPYQTEVDIQIYQGDDPDALRNILVGDFTVSGLTPVEEQNEVLCRMSLDLDGILRVTAIEKRTGLSKHITISQALTPKTEEEIAAAKERLRALYSGRAASDDDMVGAEDGSAASGELGFAGDGSEEPAVDEQAAQDRPAEAHQEARRLVARSRGLLERMHAEDKEEAVELHQAIDAAIESDDAEALQRAVGSLKELLFFVEGA